MVDIPDEIVAKYEEKHSYKLILAVIIMAIEDALQGDPGAQSWLMRPDAQFEEYCNWLGLEPEGVQRGYEKILKERAAGGKLKRQKYAFWRTDLGERSKLQTGRMEARSRSGECVAYQISG